jgi:hypothetical protein
MASSQCSRSPQRLGKPPEECWTKVLEPQLSGSPRFAILLELLFALGRASNAEASASEMGGIKETMRSSVSVEVW